MKTSSILTYLNTLTERARSEAEDKTVNNDTLYLYNAMSSYDPKAPDAKQKAERIFNVIMKLSKREGAKYAANTWNGNRGTKEFIKDGLRNGNPQVIEGNIQTYPDTLWYKAEFVPGSRVGRINVSDTYLNKDGKIDPNHIDIIDRINKKYNLNLDPNEKIVVTNESKKSRDGQPELSNNVKQFLIWRDNYFLPWFSANSATGRVFLHDYNLMLKGELNKDTSWASKAKETSGEVIENPDVVNVDTKKPEEKIVNVKKEEPVDKSTIDSIVKQSVFGAGKAIIALKNLMDDDTQQQFSKQQIYNTIRYLKSKLNSDDYKEILADYEKQYKANNPELRENVENGVDSWLSRNGDYKVFDKLNNLFRLTNESRESNMINTKLKSLKEENTFASINTTENEFNPSKTTSDMFNSNDSSLSEKNDVKKNKLTKKVIDKINKSLSLNKEVQEILDEIRKINNENEYNIWVVNEEGNTASLASKNAKIFKQNLNLCLSHDNQIELFNSVEELHDWLREHNYPMPKNIQLHESTKDSEFTFDQNDPRAMYNGLGKWIEILGLNYTKNPQKNSSDTPNEQDKPLEDSPKLKEDFAIGNMGGTTSASLGTALQYLAKNKKESLNKNQFLSKLKELKEDDTDVATDFDSDIQNNTDLSQNDISTDNTLDDTSKTDNFEDDNMGLDQDPMDNQSPEGFGDLNINTSGYGPNDDNPEEDDMLSSIPEDEYQIIDVLSDENNNIKVKVKNLNSGKIEYKDLSEIDV